jgi:mono/diheme cytochrome c family protein
MATKLKPVDAVIIGYGWTGASLRNGGLDTLATWSVEDVERLIKTGTNRSGIAFSSMNDVVIHRTQYMTPADLHATALFLKSLGGGKRQPAQYVYADDTDQALRSGDDTRRGARLYLDNCATCHRPDGQGYEAVFPSLAGNPVVQARDPASLISIVMRGSETPRTDAAPAQFTMPGFAWRLSDEEAVDVISFVRGSWGNQGRPIEATEIKKARSSLP